MHILPSDVVAICTVSVHCMLHGTGFYAKCSCDTEYVDPGCNSCCMLRRPPTLAEQHMGCLQLYMRILRHI